MYLKRKCIEKEIRTLPVSQQVSKIATIEKVAIEVGSYCKQDMVRVKGVVMDG